MRDREREADDDADRDREGRHPQAEHQPATEPVEMLPDEAEVQVIGQRRCRATGRRKRQRRGMRACRASQIGGKPGTRGGSSMPKILLEGLVVHRGVVPVHRHIEGRVDEVEPVEIALPQRRAVELAVPVLARVDVLVGLARTSHACSTGRPRRRRRAWLRAPGSHWPACRSAAPAPAAAPGDVLLGIGVLQDRDLGLGAAVSISSKVLRAPSLRASSAMPST